MTSFMEFMKSLLSLFLQASELLNTALKDSAERVVQIAQHVFLPTLAIWAMEIGTLQSMLIKSFMKQMDSILMVCKKNFDLILLQQISFMKF